MAMALVRQFKSRARLAAHEIRPLRQIGWCGTGVVGVPWTDAPIMVRGAVGNMINHLTTGPPALVYALGLL